MFVPCDMVSVPVINAANVNMPPNFLLLKDLEACSSRVSRTRTASENRQTSRLTSRSLDHWKMLYFLTSCRTRCATESFCRHCFTQGAITTGSPWLHPAPRGGRGVVRRLAQRLKAGLPRLSAAAFRTKNRRGRTFSLIFLRSEIFVFLQNLSR